MRCIICGAQLNTSDRCPNCGENARLMKKIQATANALYNDGLRKAGMRDLTGAASALNESLRLCKTNTDARNLLGLIYYEMGDQVRAISEWVISKNLQPKGNRADTYLDRVQDSPNTFESINQAMKKFNQGLSYAKQGSNDLAVIQLRKVVQLNPKMIKAHQLLALLYLQEGKYDQARKSLQTAAQIDAKNPRTLRYLVECDRMAGKGTEGQRKKKARKKKEDVVSYQSGNETIIQPVRGRADFSSVGSVFLNILVGLGVGILVTWFLLVPQVRQSEQRKGDARVEEANASVAAKEQEILSLQNEVDSLESQMEAQKGQTEASQVTVSTYQQFLAAYMAYENEDIEGAGEALSNVNPDHLDPTEKAAYEAFTAQVNEEYLTTAYNEGNAAYRRGNYSEAITHYLKIMELDETYADGDALYNLAQAYRRSGDDENGVLYSRKIVSLYPNTSRATDAERYLTSQGVTVEDEE